MTTVRVEYHREGDHWWADSIDVPGWVAGGDSLHEARELVREGLPFLLQQDDVEILESHGGMPVVVKTLSGGVVAVATITTGAEQSVGGTPHFHGSAARYEVAPQSIPA